MLDKHRILIARWSIAKTQLDRVKKQEGLLRSLIAQELFADAQLGVNRISLNDQDDVKLTKKQTISFTYDNNKMAELYINLPAPTRNETMSSLFQQEWEMSNSVYFALDDASRKIVDASGLVIIKDGMPSLDIVAKTKEV